MKVSGRRRVPYQRDVVWASLLDPAVLQKSMPGCERLSERGEHDYETEVAVGIAAIKGRYKGSVRLLDLDPPNGYRMAVEGGGGPGRVRGEGTIRLTAVNGETEITYEGEAKVAGPVAAVGQRLLTPAARRLIGQFFDQFERELAQRDGAG